MRNAGSFLCQHVVAVWWGRWRHCPDEVGYVVQRTLAVREKRVWTELNVSVKESCSVSVSKVGLCERIVEVIAIILIMGIF